MVNSAIHRINMQIMQTINRDFWGLNELSISGKTEMYPEKKSAFCIFSMFIMVSWLMLLYYKVYVRTRVDGGYCRSSCIVLRWLFAHIIHTADLRIWRLDWWLCITSIRLLYNLLWYTVGQWKGVMGSWWITRTLHYWVWDNALARVTT